jgi:hypothetical protein
MEEQKPKTIAEEAGLPENWVPVEVKPVVPISPEFAGYPIDGASKFLTGSLPPGYQHDTSFVGTSYRASGAPRLDVMPLGIQGNPATNAAISSTAIKSVNAAVAPAPADDVESIASNVQTGTTYTVVDSDRNTLISMTNNAGGTVILPGPAATIAFVQKSDFSGTAHSVSTTITNVSGNFMYLSLWNGNNTAFTVSDTKGNVWVLIDTTLDGGGNTTSNYYAANIAGGSNTITVSFSGGGALLNAVVMEYSGVQMVSPLDVHAFTLSGSGTTITTGFANDLVIYSSPECDTETAAAPWTARYNTPSTFSGFQLGQDQVVSAASTVVHTLGATTPGIPNNFTQFIAAFKTSSSVANVFEAGWFTYIENTGTGTFIVESNAQIDGAIQTITLAPNQGVLVVYDGTNYYTERGIGLAIPVTVPNGGTGRATLTAHAVLLGEGTSPVGFASPGTAGQVLTSNGSSADPTFQSLPGTAVTKTADYNLALTDNYSLVQMDSSSAHTITLLGTAPTGSFWVVIKNLNTGVLTVARNGLTIDGKSSNLTLAQGDSVMIFSDGSNYKTGMPRIGDVYVSTAGAGVNSQNFARFRMTRAITFPAGAPNAYADASVAATGSTTVTLKKAGSSFATVVWSAAGTVGAWTQASDAVFAAGDLFEIDGPATADATLADISFSLQGYRF